MLEESTVAAEHNRTVSLLNHIADLRQLLKAQIDKSNTLSTSQSGIEHSLRQVCDIDDEGCDGIKSNIISHYYFVRAPLSSPSIPSS